VIVNEDGDMTLMDFPRTYTGFDRRKTYAFRTDGTLENRGHHAFYGLVTSANAFHNYGTIQAYSSHFYNNYRFNSGAIKLGELPIAVADLTKDLPETTAEPSFKHHVVENYGQFISNGKYDVRGGLNYRELGESIMSDLEMSGEDISVFKGRMNVAGTLFGEVGRFAVIDGTSSVYVNRFEKVPWDVRGVNGGILYTSDEERSRLKRLELEKETDLAERLGDAIYDGYVRIKKGELLNEYERQTYKERYGNAWAEEAAIQKDREGLKGGGVVESIVAVGIGAAIGCASKHGSVSVGVGSSGRVQVRATNNAAYRDRDFEATARQYSQQRQAYEDRPRAILRESMARQQREQQQAQERMNQIVNMESRERTRIYTPVRKVCS
jgi:hypothetical protein